MPQRIFPAAFKTVPILIMYALNFPANNIFHAESKNHLLTNLMVDGGAGFPSLILSLFSKC